MFYLALRMLYMQGLGGLIASPLLTGAFFSVPYCFSLLIMVD
jgi:hypothetical protein